MKYDYLIVGSGLFGSVFAYEAKKSGKKVIVLEKRNHIGGNCYTENIDGINIHKYGPHIFHTNNKKIWDYINQFAEFNHFIHRPKVNYNNRIYSFPINLFTLYQLWGVSSPKEAEERLNQAKRIVSSTDDNLEDWIVSQVGQEIYEIFIKGYTEKQWGRDPRNLPSSIIKRIPIRLTYDDNYFFDKYQGIPIGGYTQIFDKLLDSIEIIQSDFFKDRKYFESIAHKIVYTGKIDELFDYEYGKLSYRSLRFEHESFDGDFQGNAIVNYTSRDIPFTRITEHKHFEFNTNNRSIITKEFPEEYSGSNTPYYPINDTKNITTYNLYKDKVKSISNYILGGRLAEYRYYDMHQIIASSLNCWSKQ
jgi:UDP-galactopyranose mutase